MNLGEKYPNIAYFYIIAGSIFLTVNHVLFKMGSSLMAPFHMLFIRSLSLFLINLQILKKMRVSPYILS